MLHTATMKFAVPLQEIIGSDGTTDVYVARQCSRCGVERVLKPGEDFFSRTCPDCKHLIGGAGGGDYYFAYRLHVDANGKLPEHLEPLREQIMAGQPVPLTHTINAEHQLVMTDQWLWVFDMPAKSYGPQSPHVNETAI
jgi:hypothetical protein